MRCLRHDVRFTSGRTCDQCQDDPGPPIGIREVEQIDDGDLPAVNFHEKALIRHAKKAETIARRVLNGVLEVEKSDPAVVALRALQVAITATGRAAELAARRFDAKRMLDMEATLRGYTKAAERIRRGDPDSVTH